METGIRILIHPNLREELPHKQVAQKKAQGWDRQPRVGKRRSAQANPRPGSGQAEMQAEMQADVPVLGSFTEDEPGWWPGEL